MVHNVVGDVLIMSVAGHDGFPLAVDFGLSCHHTTHRLSNHFFTPGFVPLLGLACGGDVITSGTAQVQCVHQAHNMRAKPW